MAIIKNFSTISKNEESRIEQIQCGPNEYQSTPKDFSDIMISDQDFEDIGLLRFQKSISSTFIFTYDTEALLEWNSNDLSPQKTIFPNDNPIIKFIEEIMMENPDLFNE